MVGLLGWRSRPRLRRSTLTPRRLTGLTAKQQRDLTNAVKRARIVALLPFVNPEG